MNQNEVQEFLDRVEAEAPERMCAIEHTWRQLAEAIIRKLAYPQVGPRAEYPRYWQDK